MTSWLPISDASLLCVARLATLALQQLWRECMGTLGSGDAACEDGDCRSTAVPGRLLRCRVAPAFSSVDVHAGWLRN